MHILLTNDDGIGFKGIMALLREATKRGHRVSMCAPRDPQSAMSHRISLVDPIFVADYPVECTNAKGYAIAGSPTDCVRVGLHILENDPVDAIVSGINNGYNAGMAVHYSGTVAAAIEGMMLGYPSVATSIHERADAEMIDYLAARSIDAVERLVAKKDELPPQTFLNINMPCRKPSELLPPVYAPLCTSAFLDGYEQRESPRAGTYYWMTKESKFTPAEQGCDIDCLKKGHIVYSLLGNPVCLPEAAWDKLAIL